jgi:epsilon-lactone hydrolase
MSKQQQVELDAMLRQAPFDQTADVAALRSGFEALMQQIPVPGDVNRTFTAVGGVNVVEVTIEDSEPTDVVLYFHGGVYVIGSAESSIPLVADLARRSNTRVISVDYRLAPENPYPAAIDDAKAAYQGLLAQGVDPRNIAFSGESAGGGLAVAALLAAKDADMPMPSAVFAMSPWVDLTLSGNTILNKQARDPLLTGEGLRVRVGDYVAEGSPSNPYISPIFGDLRGLPPMLIQVGSHEVLLSDAVRLAERAARDDVSVTLEVVAGVPHVFQAYAGLLEEGDAALNRAATFLTTHFVSAPERDTVRR